MGESDSFPDWREYADRTFLISDNGEFSYADLTDQVRCWSETVLPWEDGALLAIPGHYQIDALAFQVFSASLNRFVLAPVEWPGEIRQHTLLSLNPDWVWGNYPAPDGWQFRGNGEYALRQRLGGEGGLVLPTTGTTGERKWVLHRIRPFVARYRRQHLDQELRVLPLMTPDHVSGQDILWRALWQGATLVIPAQWSPEGVGEAIVRHRVQFLAATPSYLRSLWLRGIMQHYDWSSVQRISYGGEVMPESLLSALRAALPHVRWDQRYGSSEMSTISASDAGDGFLHFRIDEERWKIEQDQLWLRRPASWAGYLNEQNIAVAGDWFPTGDRVLQREDGAIRILGRQGLLINVGGEKVSPEEVESCVSHLDGVLSCRAYGEKHPLMGNVVALDLYVPEDRRSENWRLAVRSWCQGRLPSAAIPVHVRLVDTSPQWQSKIVRH
jgi:acyl-coenzyme A synthetase/AMP-(fatty) acid ligase